MEDLIIEVDYSKELFCRITRHQTAKDRKRMIGLSFFFGLLAVLLIAGDIFSDSMKTATAGIFFAIFSVVFLLYLMRLSPKSIQQMVDKNRGRYPQRTTYSFFVDKFVVETDFSVSRVRGEHEYTAISKVQKVDEKTLYILLYNNTYCAIESDRCKEIIDWISPKVVPGCMEV